MMKVVPINMVTAPNFWVPSKTTYWNVTDAVADDIWGLLTISDSLGDRPYVPAVGATLTATFQRGDFIGSVSNQGLTVTKTAVLDSMFRALVKFPLTSNDAKNIISGTILFTLVEGSHQNIWTANWAVKKLNTSAGF